MDQPRPSTRTCTFVSEGCLVIQSFRTNTLFMLWVRGSWFVIHGLRRCSSTSGMSTLAICTGSIQREEFDPNSWQYKYHCTTRYCNSIIPLTIRMYYMYQYRGATSCAPLVSEYNVPISRIPAKTYSRSDLTERR